MKKILIACMLLASCFASAQSKKVKKTPEQRVDNITQKLKVELALNDDQYAKAKDLNTKTLQSLKEIKMKYHEQMRAERKKLEEETDAQYKSFLTPEQYTKYLQIKEAKKQKMKEKRGNDLDD